MGNSLRLAYKARQSGKDKGARGTVGSHLALGYPVHLIEAMPIIFSCPNLEVRIPIRGYQI